MGSNYRSSSTILYASRTNTTMTAPAGIQDGDVLILGWYGLAAAPPVPAAPAEFKQIAMATWPVQLGPDGSSNRVHLYVWYKIAASESGNYTITHASATSQGYIVAVSGGGGNSPQITVRKGTGTTSTADAITTIDNDTYIMYFTADWLNTTNTLAVPAGTTPTFTARCNQSIVGGDSPLYAADGVLATAGDTGSKSNTNNNGGGGAGFEFWAGFLIAVHLPAPPTPSAIAAWLTA